MSEHTYIYQQQNIMHVHMILHKGIYMTISKVVESLVVAIKKQFFVDP